MISDLIGVPFIDGGRDPITGLDCWGLAREVFRRFGINLPDYTIGSNECEKISRQIIDQMPLWKEHQLSCLPVPSLVIIRFSTPVYVNHCGVYLGEGRFIHTREKIGVNIDRIDAAYWKHRIVGFYTPLVKEPS